MASPFRAFRKYQKSLLVVAGVVLMFVFVLGDPLSQYLRSNSPGTGSAGQHPNDVAVKWNGGQLTNAELGQLVMQRLITNNFLRQVEGIGQNAAAEAGGEPQPLRVAVLLGPEQPEQGVEQDVVRTRLFADAARKAGMAVSDEYIVNYLSQLGRGYVSVDMIRQLLSANAVGGRHVPVDYALDALREEILARNFLASYYYALETELPEDRWRDWLRANDRVVVEAVAVPAESLLVDVNAPSDAELAAFFDEFKDNEPMPDTGWGVELPSPNPGFEIPQQVATQFLLADFNQFLAKIEDEVTDAEIEKFYEDNKDPYFIRAESVLSEPGDDVLEEAETKDVAPQDAAPKETAPSDDAKSAPATNDESTRSRKSPFRLTAFAEDAPAESEAKGSTDTAAAAPDFAAPSETPADAAPTAELAPPAEKPKDFQPLDEVRDQIRRIIAEAKVTEQLEKLMGDLERELNDSYTEYFGASLDAEDAGKEPPPPPAKLADLTPLAEKNGLVYQKTEPASMLELRDTAVGKSGRPDWGNTRFFQAIFARDLELYEPVLTVDLDANRYLAMKTQDIPGKVPTLDEVHDQVVRAWKLREAGKLAVKRAEELAKQAQERGGPLAETFGDDKSLATIKTDPFSYLTIGTLARDSQQAQSFRLSEPDGIVAAGPEFMEKVFDLKEGEVAAAPNHDRSIAYVVRIAEHLSSPAELQQAFLSEDFNWYGVQAMTRGHFQTALRAVIADMLQSADVDWVRDPDQVIRPQEDDEAEAEAEKS